MRRIVRTSLLCAIGLAIGFCIHVSNERSESVLRHGLVKGIYLELMELGNVKADGSLAGSVDFRKLNVIYNSNPRIRTSASFH